MIALMPRWGAVGVAFGNHKTLKKMLLLPLSDEYYDE